MALIRQVLQHPTTKKWAYCEYSDEDRSIGTILGGKEFETQEEAEEWRKGFKTFSYEWQDPKETAAKELAEEKEQLQKRLAEIEAEQQG